ncbi:RNA polymerase III RPC4 [Toxoplasma gondii RUB]|uniref:RNA polymerase III RPC4 n=11 Tax=Toxoplasma gondii TaxID=5811 RepID=A0A125YML4_TOXGV|nr:hypothetical protein TGGT1_266680 [Toxoplasma gondii GT1]ESS33491.1 RNA polymerase III RPC4 [Toxoplasma gondii VEG]KAF4644133.1 hypothetical protein TGRH88_011310 [Toxoplasma gondii]KFG28120.1 RNA polymerase III RPC4 [Toxoplasma gondii p89]KFG38768.1 RNA polymerase III RPC4 [Toxoplasma gondii GAB2-2007-GAL-DOM2]KFG43151.1 RNA polymerase III RPC4 [Toxoplasma gondii FOU]KFG58849.1 RNA polymerase III RPC4 [Toxoplasma gondii RUB]KFH01797.1 RNA polymerase III RPC4 [Toxoplasma gondii VAND]KFH1
MSGPGSEAGRQVPSTGSARHRQASAPPRVRGADSADSGQQPLALRAVSSNASFASLNCRRQPFRGPASPSGNLGFFTHPPGQTPTFIPYFSPPGTPSPPSFSRGSRPNAHTPSPGSGHSDGGPSCGHAWTGKTAKLEEGVLGYASSVPAPRKFVPNLSKSGAVLGVKTEEKPTAAFDCSKGNLSAMVLRSLQTGETKKVAQGKFEPGGRRGAPAFGSPPDSCGGTAASPIGFEGGRRPLHLASPAAIRESNLRLMYQHQLFSKDGKKADCKKSRRLMELSWIGMQEDDEDALSGGTSGCYTPISLPFVVREGDGGIEGVAHQRSVSDTSSMGMETATARGAESRRKRPSARHVEEANRFAAGLLLVGNKGEERGERGGDTWDLADGEDGSGTDFLHICFPSLFPPMDRQAMNEARQARAAEREARRCNTRGARDGDASECGSQNATKDSATQGAKAGVRSGAPGNGKKSSKTSQPAKPVGPSPPLPLASLPDGRIGKLLLHRSGRVELRLLSAMAHKSGCSLASKSDCGSGSSADMQDDERGKGLGGTLTKNKSNEEPGMCFEVNIGSECTFAQEVGCLVEDTSEFLFLGKCNKRMVIAPDVQRCLRPVTACETL